MDRYRKILVSIDAATDIGDEMPHALTRGIRLAQETGAELRVVATADEIPKYLQELLQGPNVIAEEYALHVERLFSKVDLGIKLSHSVLSGRPIAELLGEVEQYGADLLIRDVSVDDETHDTFFSSLDLRLLRNCPTPVWMVNRDPSSCERVLAAIDPLPETEHGERLNHRVLDAAASLAAWENARLHIVSAWEVGSESILVQKLGEAEFRGHTTDIANKARRNLKTFLKDLTPIPRESHVRFDNCKPATLIRNYAREIDADVIVMGSVARSGIPGLLMGDTAEEVLRTIRSSVLAIKPSLA